MQRTFDKNKKIINSFYNDPIPSDFKSGNSNYTKPYIGKSSFRNASTYPVKNNLLERFYNSLGGYDKKKNLQDPIIIIPSIGWAFIGILSAILSDVSLIGSTSKLLIINLIILLIEFAFITFYIFVPAFSSKQDINGIIRTIKKIFYVSFLAFLLLFCGNFGWLYCINCKLDVHIEKESYILVEKKEHYFTEGKKSHHKPQDNYRLYLSAENNETICIGIDKSMFDRVTEDTVLNLTTKSGFLGIPYWIPSKSFNRFYKKSEFPDNTKFPVSKSEGDILMKEKLYNKFKK